MKKDKPITIDADTARRLQLNAERTPRETVYVEATNTINPITGRRYEDQFFVPELKSEPIYDFSNIRLFDKKYMLSILNPPSITPFLQLQKALGMMGVRERDIPEFEYGMFLDDVKRLADVYAENPSLTLESITDGNGLNAALRKIERQSELEKFPKDEMDNVFSLINRINKNPNIFRIKHLIF